MFILKEVIRNKDKREKFIKEVKENISLTKEESKLLHISYKIDDIENFLNVVGIKFNVLINNNILEERIPSQKEIPKMKHIKYLNCKLTNIEKVPQINNLKKLNYHYTNMKEIPYLPNLEFLDCSFTNIEKIPPLENLKELNCKFTNVKEIPYMPNLEKIYPKNIKMRNK